MDVSSLASPASPARILVVDDNADRRDYVLRLLSRDYEVAAVSDGWAALEAVQQHLPDLVLTDGMMPGLDGLGLLRSLRHDPVTQNIPIILLSARAAEESEVEGLEAGADDYLIKPFGARELLARVRTNLELARLRREAVRYQEQLRVEAQAAQKQLNTILESITDAFVAFDREWRYTYVNEQATRLLHKTREELLGKQVWAEVFPERVGTLMYRELYRAVTEQVAVVFEDFSPSLGIWMEVHAYPSPEGLAVYFQDITERKQTEVALRQNEEQARLAIKVGRLGTWRYNLHTGLVELDKRMREIWGQPEDVGTMPLSRVIERIHPDDRQRVTTTISTALDPASSGTYEIDYRIIWDDGTQRWVSANGRVQFEGEGKSRQPIDFFGTALDITDVYDELRLRQQAEAALRQSEERLRLTTEGANIGLWYWDVESNKLTWNDRAKAMFGLSADVEMSMQVLLNAVHPDDRQLVQTIVTNLQAGPVHTENEYRTLWADGTVRWILARGNSDYNDDGILMATRGVLIDITERKQTEQALRQAEERLRVALQHAPITVFNQDRELRYTWIHNPVVHDLHEMLDQCDRDFLPPEDAERLTAIKQRVLETGIGVREEIKITKNEADYYYDLTVEPLRNTRNAIVDITGAAIDVSDLKRTELDLRESESRFRSIADHSPMMIWISAPDGAGIWFNQQWCEFTGQTLNEALGSGWVAAIHPEDALAIETACLQAHQRHEPVRLEYRLRRQDGEYRWVFDSAVPRFDGAGVYLGYIGSIIDITERKQAQQELQQTLQTLTTLINASPLPIVVIQPDMTVQLWNPAAEQLFGWREAEVLGQPIPIVPAEKRDECRQVREAVAKGKVFVSVETYRCKRDGATVIVSISAAPLSNEQGSLEAILLIFQDITQRQRAEEALRQSEERLRLALLVSKAGIWDWDILHNHVTWSEHIYEFHGLDPGTFGGRVEDFAQLIHPDDRSRVSEAIRQALEEKGSYELEFRAVQPSGAVRWLSTTGGVIFDTQGHPIRMLGATRDITERKAVDEEREQLLLSEQRAREEAERANRIKDEFLAVLSHELRSPLNPILGWAKLLQSRTLDEQKTKHALVTIERNAKKLQTQLIEDLLDVSRILRGKLVLNASPVNLTNTIEAALETVRLAADAKGIPIQRVLDPNVGQVMGESARLQQVIWNLLSNAVKFTPSGGTIEIRLEQIHTDAQIQVRDTGKGITREFLPYVFEYFRQEDGTTTRKFGGLGLGLAIVRHLVELHGGTVWAESPGEGLGATFTVRLPLMPPSPQTPHNNSSPAPITHLTGLQILVVDDEPDIRDIVGFILEQAGATVRGAASAPEALNLIEQSLPDVLISDIGMPDMDGYILIRLLRARPPEQGGQIPAIALTAYAGEYDQKQALAAGFQQHIAKPVEPDELVRAIARLVQHPQST